MRTAFLAATAAAFLSSGTIAQDAPKPAPKPAPAPRLIVAISVDQFSANLFDKYRSHFQYGLKRLADGVAFSRGFQSHAATETCPGHSTILSGVRPATSGIIANDWYAKRVNKDGREVFAPVYCVEDERERERTVSTWHVDASRYKTLGDRLLEAGKGSKVYSVAGKDRAAVMLGGKIARNSWWYDADTGSFTSFPKTVAGEVPDLKAAIDGVNGDIVKLLATPTDPAALSAYCEQFKKPLQASEVRLGGGPRPKWPAARSADPKDPTFRAAASGFRMSEVLDAKTVQIAKDMVDKAGLGDDDAVDVLAVGLSATDYVGHGLSPGGPEMCAQLESVDAAVGDLFAHLEAKGIPFVAMLTADHGGEDMPERMVWEGAVEAHRASPLFGAVRALDGASPLGPLLERKCGLKGDVLRNIGVAGDYWFTDAVPAADRPKAAACAKREVAKLPDVEAVVTAADLRKVKMPTGAPDKWTLLQRTRASYMNGRSGDFYVFLHPGITPITGAGVGYVATHGTPWDYDRRVPILFWGPNLGTADRREAVETVDILPTLASLVGLTIPAGDVDGRCLDLVSGPATNCP